VNLANLWDGTPNAGHLLIKGDLGFGDIFLTARCIRQARRRVGSVTLMVHPSLVRLFRAQYDNITVVPNGTAIPAWDAWTIMECLPHLVGGTDPLRITQSYLVSRESFEGLSGSFKVGIVWAGSGSFGEVDDRSTRLEDWYSVLACSGPTFYSFQVGGHQPELGRLNGHVHDLAPRLTDWARTAAALSHIDLLITCDTGIASLAGGLGIPVWILLSASGAERWGLDETTARWFPSMRIFRQCRFGDWPGVFAEVARYLATVTRERTLSLVGSPS
jgi:hypothetical protein